MLKEKEMDIANLKQYLLGNLPPPETEAVDLQIISDEISEETLLWAESELMEDYLDEALTPAEISLFKQNFLVSPERVTQFKQISLMRTYARSGSAKSAAENTLETRSISFFENLKNFFSLNRGPAIAVFSFLLIGLLAVFYFTANDQTVTEKEFAALNRNDLSDLAKFQTLSSLSLSGGTFRDAGDTRKLAANTLTEKVLFRLALPIRAGVSDKFRAELVKNREIVFTQLELPFYNNPNGQEIRLLLPSAELTKGTYQIKITSASSPDSTLIYNFGVE
jgi:hypothetical protein